MKKLADEIVPDGINVTAVKYYIAPVSGKNDPDAPRRQQRLFSAMKTIPEISIYKGRFLFGEKWAGLVQPPEARPVDYSWAGPPHPKVVKIKKTEEKGSDVNLASHLIRDAFTDAFDIAYIITNDTDFEEAIRIVTEEVKKEVCIVAPHHQRGNVPVPAPSLEAVATSKHYIDDAELAKSQFPDIVQRVGKRDIHKPETWVKSQN